MLSYPTSHLPTWFRTSVLNSSSVRVEFAGQHFVEIYPEQQRYISDLRDVDLCSLWSAVPVQVMSLPHSELPPREGHSLKQLHWAVTLSYVQSEQRSRNFKFQIAKLVSWPSLTDVPSDVLPVMVRICALLSRRPTTTSLVPMILDVPQDLAFALIEVNCLYGHIEMEGGEQVAGAAEKVVEFSAASVATEQSLVQAPPEQTGNSSLIRKIWQRLLAPRG